MDNLMADIEDGRSIKVINQFKEKIIECAKTIKSNDKTFKIQTLTEVESDLEDLMRGYLTSVKNAEASHNTFLELLDTAQRDEAESQGNEPVNLPAVDALFKETLERHLQAIPEDTNTLQELDVILKSARAQDEDIEVEEPREVQVPKDPITQTNIKKAVRCRACNHIYDKTSIEEYFKQKEKSKSRVPCPVAGCTVRAMTRKDLIPDDETNKIIESLKA